MRVLQVLPSLDAADGGVPAAAVHSNLAKRRIGIDLTIAYVVKGDTEGALAALRESGVDVIGFGVFPHRSYLARRWSISPRLAWWLARHVREFDVVHVDGAWGLPAAVAVLIGKLRGRPVAVTPHAALMESDVRQSSSPARRLAKQLLRAYYARFSDLLTFSSELERNDSVGSSSVRTVVIPHPVVEGAEAQPSARASEAGRRTIGFLGRIHPTKNVDLLLRVLAHQPSSVRLIIAGSGADGLMAELTGLAAAEGVEDRVEWRGFVDAEGRARFFEDVDLLVVPSTYECFGMSGAEALAAGVPVIASERTGIAEIIRASGGGAVCAPEEAAVGAALGAAWDPGALDRWSREAAAAATASLSYAAYGSSIDEAYRLLVSAGSRS